MKMKEFFDIQMGLNVCEAAKEKFMKAVLPKLCVEHDICPLCGGELEVYDDVNAAFMYSSKQCKDCEGKFSGDKSYGRPNVKSKTFLQE
jgi:hypothetical protein